MKVKLVHGGGGGGGGGWDEKVGMALLGWDFSATGPGGNLVMIDPHTSL